MKFFYIVKFSLYTLIAIFIWNWGGDRSLNVTNIYKVQRTTQNFRGNLVKEGMLIRYVTQSLLRTNNSKCKASTELKADVIAKYKLWSWSMGGGFPHFCKPHREIVVYLGCPHRGEFAIVRIKRKWQIPVKCQGGGECWGLELTESLLQKPQIHSTLTCVAGGFVGAREIIQHLARQQSPQLHRLISHNCLLLAVHP